MNRFEYIDNYQRPEPKGQYVIKEHLRKNPTVTDAACPQWIKVLSVGAEQGTATMYFIDMQTGKNNTLPLFALHQYYESI